MIKTIRHGWKKHDWKTEGFMTVFLMGTSTIGGFSAGLQINRFAHLV